MNIFHWLDQLQDRFSHNHYGQQPSHSRFSLFRSRWFSRFSRQPAYVRKQQVDPNTQARRRRGRRRK